MWIRRILFLSLILILAEPSQASGPFQPACANEQKAAEDTLKDLRTCLEKAGAKKRQKKSSEDACKTGDQAHQTAVAALKECLAGASAQPTQKSEATKP